MKHTLPVILLICLIVSCQKEINEPVPAPEACSVYKQVIFDDAGDIYDSAFYAYNSGKLIQVSNIDGSINFEYSAGKITKRKFYSANATLPEGYDTIKYNSDGTIKTIEQYLEFMGTMEKYKELAFSYNSGKLTNLKNFEDDGLGSLQLASELSYHYTGNNATRVVSKSYIDGNLNETITMTLKFDAKPNYFHKIDNQIFLTDPFQYEFEGLSLITLVSQNNIVKMEYPDNPNDEPDVLSYIADSKGNLSTFSVNGTKGLQFSFKCP